MQKIAAVYRHRIRVLRELDFTYLAIAAQISKRIGQPVSQQCIYKIVTGMNNTGRLRRWHNAFAKLDAADAVMLWQRRHTRREIATTVGVPMGAVRMYLNDRLGDAEKRWDDDAGWERYKSDNTAPAVAENGVSLESGEIIC